MKKSQIVIVNRLRHQALLQTARKVFLLHKSYEIPLQNISLETKWQGKKKVIIRSFPGAIVKDMADYVKPSLANQPEEVIIYT